MLDFDYGADVTIFLQKECTTIDELAIPNTTTNNNCYNISQINTMNFTNH